MARRKSGAQRKLNAAIARSRGGRSTVRKRTVRSQSASQRLGGTAGSSVSSRFANTPGQATILRNLL